jgi:hypothetical protein
MGISCVPPSRVSHLKLQEGFQQNLELKSSLGFVRTLSNAWCLLGVKGAVRTQACCMTRLRAALPAKNYDVVHSSHLIDVIGRVSVETTKW